MITRDRQVLNTPPEKWLPGVLQQFLQGLPRLERLHRYAQGRHDVLGRQREEGLPNARLELSGKDCGYRIGLAYEITDIALREGRGGAASAAALDASTQTEELTGRPPLQGQADPARQAEGAIVAPGGGVELQRHEDVQPLPPADAGADLPASAAEPMPDASEALPPLDDASAAQ